MNSEFNPFEYSPEKLRSARICIVQNRFGFLNYVFCPHCHISLSGQPLNKASVAAHQVTEYTCGYGVVVKKEAAVLKCCPECGQIYRDVRNREPAITGRQAWPPFAVHLLVLDAMVLAGYLFFLYFRDYQGCIAFMEFSWEKSAQCQSTSVILEIMSPAAEAVMYAVLLMIFMAASFLAALIMVRKREREVRLSEKRLRNIDYLRAMERTGIRLPEKFRRYIRESEKGSPPGDTGMEKSGKITAKDEVFLAENGSCGYCGYLLRRHPVQSIGRSVIRCPQCRSAVYDPYIHELAALPEKEAREIFSKISRELIIGVTRYGALALLVLVLLYPSVIYTRDFLVLLFSGKITVFEIMGSDLSWKIAFLAIAILFSRIRMLYFLIMAVVLRIRLYCGDFTTAFRESRNRMNCPEYAAKFWKARNLKNNDAAC